MRWQVAWRGSGAKRGSLAVARKIGKVAWIFAADLHAVFARWALQLCHAGLNDCAMRARTRQPHSQLPNVPLPPQIHCVARAG